MSAVAGLDTMVRLVLRRDRVRLTAWVIGVSVLLLSSVASVTALYDTVDARQTYSSAVGDNPVAVMMGGPGAGLPSLGAIVVFEMGIVAYVAVGFMSVLTTVRHTRAEEEAGRTELLRAGVVGRYAGPVAAVVVVGAANVVVGAALAAGMVTAGLPLAGTLVLSASVVAFGVVMAAVAAVAAQLTEHSRGATGLGTAVLAVFFILRAAGDIGAGGLSWISPMGWAIAVRPFAGERPAVLLLLVGLAAVLTAGALALVDRRDVGGGLVAARPGRTAASRWLAGPLGLAVRQHRASFAGWGVGLFLLGAAYGSVGDAVQELVSQNEALADFLAASGTSLVDSFFAVAASMMALMAAGFALQVSIRMRTEESAGRLEPLLATAVPRWRWAVSHLLVAALGSALLLVLAGSGMGLAHATLTGDATQVARLTAAALVHMPAVWVLVGVVAALFGLVPRAVPAAWSVLAACAAGLLLGPGLRLPPWAMDLSPFQHVPQVPAEALAVKPLTLLTAVAAVLVAAGLLGLRHRDVSAA